MATKYSNEEIIEKYKKFADELGRTPTQEDVNNKSKSNKNFPNNRTIYRRFGGLNNLNKLCSLETRYVHNSKEELIVLLQRFYDEYGFPSKKKINKVDYMPNAEMYRIHFGSFENAIKSANIPIPLHKQNSLKNNKVYLDNDELLDKLRNVIEVYGIIPSSEFKKYDLPSMVVYRNRFGTYKEILDLLNIDIPEDIQNKYFSEFKHKTDEELIELLKEYNKKFGLPTTRDLKNNTVYPSDYIYRTRFGSFENALKIAGIEIPENRLLWMNRTTVDTETILNIFKEYIYENFAEKDMLPGMKDLIRLCNIPSESVLSRRFNGIADMYFQIGVDYYKHNNHALELDMIDKYIKLKDILGYVPDSRDIDRASKIGLCYGMKTYSEHFGSLIDFQKTLGFKPTANLGLLKTKEEMLIDLKELGTQLGRLPTQKDVNECEWCVSTNCYGDTFNGYTNALILAGFDQNWYNRKVSITPKGNIAFSSYEYDFLLMLEDRNFIFQKEEYYKKYIQGFDRRLQFDFTLFLNDEIYFVEIFGIMEYEWYRDKTKYKIQLCEDNNLKLIDLYKEDFRKSDINTLYNLLVNKINKINLLGVAI